MERQSKIAQRIDYEYRIKQAYKKSKKCSCKNNCQVCSYKEICTEIEGETNDGES